MAASPLLPLLAALALAAVADDPEPLDYDAFARGFLEAHGAAGAQPGGVTLDALLDDRTRYRSVDLGALDVRVPKDALLDRDRAKELAEAARAVLGVQRAFYAWAVPDAEARAAALADFATLERWVGGWSVPGLASFGRADDGDFLERLGASDEERAAHARVRELLCTGSFLGLTLPAEPTTRLLLVPDRVRMLQALCFTGWCSPESRPYYWKKGVEQWTSFWNGEIQVIAMEYPAYPFEPRRPERGAPMDEFEKTGLGQHAAEKAAASLFWRYFGSNDALFFEAALATNLTVAVFGENNVRTGAPVYKNSGGSSGSYEVFVPGGNAAGGTLPGRGAITVIDIPLWRETKGEDNYAGPLKKAQKLGDKLARKARDPLKDDRAHFQVHGEKTSDKLHVSAPFFGPAAAAKPLPPKAYLEDYEEFFRAYRAGFFHWVRTRAAGDEAQSAAAFAKLLGGLAAHRATFEALAAEVYGVPLSAPDASSDSLEWRFLTWLDKGAK